MSLSINKVVLYFFLLLTLLVTFIIGLNVNAHSQENRALAILRQGQVGGAIQDVAVNGIYTYISVGTRIVVLNTSDASNPQIVGRSEPIFDFTLDIALADNHIYVTNNEKLAILNVDDPENPTLTGELLIDGARYVTVANGVAYISGTNIISIVNVTDPTKPELITTYSELGVFGGSWRSAIQDDLLIIAAGGGRGFVLLNVSDPAAPVRVGTYPGVPNHSMVSVAIEGNYAYGGGDGVHIVDISDPANPTRVGFYEPDVPAAPRTLTKSDDSLYATLSGYGTFVLDVSNPLSPTLRSKIDVPFGSANDAVVQNDVAYIAWINTGLQILDVSDANNPIERSRFEQIDDANDIVIAGEYAFVLEGGSGVWVVDVSDYANPNVKGFHTVGGSNLEITIQGDYAYIAGGDSGLHVVNISDPMTLVEVGNVSFGEDSSAWDVTVIGNYAYIADYDNGLQVVDISVPSNPTTVGSFTTSSRTDVFSTITAAGTTVYLQTQDGFNGFYYVLDISDPSNPTEITRLDNVSSLLAQDSRLYLTESEQVNGQFVTHFKIWDMSDPLNPSQISMIEEWDVHPLALDVVGNYVFIVGSENTGTFSSPLLATILDISTPTAPVEIDRQYDVGSALDIAGHGNNMLIADGYSGLLSLYLGEPPDPLPNKVYIPIVIK